MDRNEKGQFQKGHQKKGGRKKGSKNATAGELKNRITALIEKKFDDVISDIDAMEPKDRVNTFLKLLEYVLPKQRQIDQKIDISKLSDSEVDQLFDAALNKAEWTNDAS